MGDIKKKQDALVEEAMEACKDYVRDGIKWINIIDLWGKWRFGRQVLARITLSGKKERIIPIDAFFGERKRGVGHVSGNLERKAIESALEGSYRQAEKGLEKSISKDSIQRKIVEKGRQAQKLGKTRETTKIVQEEETKDANGDKDTYKRSKGSRIRAVFGKIFGWTRLYLMVDGVGVQAQDRINKTRGEWTGSKECKVASILKQNGAQIEEVGTFGTWERIVGFRKLVEITMLGAIGIAGLFAEVVIISDGAKWIRNLRGKIIFLKNAIWILDWFHVKDRVEKLILKLEINIEGKRSEKIRKLLWLGKVDEAIKRIKQLPLGKGKEKRAMQRAAKKVCIKYLENQKEGIVNYQEYQMRGYFVGSGFVEKKNDTLIKNRMVRQKRMRWSKIGGEAMMQLLTAQMNGRLGELFC